MTKKYWYHMVNLNSYELIGVYGDSVEDAYTSNNLNREEWKLTAFFEL